MKKKEGNMKKFKIENIKTFGKSIKKQYQKLYQNYPLVVWFILSSIINSCLLRGITVNNPLCINALLGDLGTLLIISSLTVFSKRKKNYKLLLFISIITTTICIINSAYYTYYSSFASVSLLATATFIVEVGDAVVDQVIELKDFIYLWQPIFIFILYRRQKKAGSPVKQTQENKKFAFSNLFTTGIISLILASCLMTPTDWSRFSKMWNRESVVNRFGIYVYQLNDIVQSLEPKVTNLFGHDKALKNVVEYYQETNKNQSTNKYTNILEGKNIIVIHAESFQTLAMNLSFHGKEVTPNVNKLAQEGIFFSNYYSQVGVGTSSDAEFTFSTSLMPSSTGTVFVSYFDNEFISIQKLLKEKGYYTVSMHGNTADFWNRSIMHKNLGYDKFYSKTYYEIDETIGLGLSDKSFFRQSVQYLKKIAQNNEKYYANLITLTNHTPFTDLELMDEYPTTIDVELEGMTVTRNYLEGTTLGNYLRSIHYADQAIGQFIEQLDQEGLLENTAIVIYGDHDSRISKSNYNLLYNYDPITDTIKTEEDEGYIDYNDCAYQLDKKVPFIIWTKDTKYQTEVTTPTGMIDALPTLGNMLGIKSQYQLGNDIFSMKEEDNTVIFTDSSYITNKVYYNSQKNEIYPLTNEAIDESHITERSNYANKIIEISNDIISYDLIKEMNEKESTSTN